MFKRTKISLVLIPLLAVALVLCFVNAGLFAKQPIPQEKASLKKPTYKADEVLVKFKGVTMPSTAGGQVKPELAAAALPANAQRAIATLNAQVTRAFSLTGVVKLKLPLGVSVADAVKTLKASGSVTFAEPNFLLYICQPDPLFDQQWYLQDPPGISAVDAWSKRTRSQWLNDKTKNVVVAVLDTGIDEVGPYPYKPDWIWPPPNPFTVGIHMDLYGNLWKNTKEHWDNDFDDDGNRFIDDFLGVDFAYGEEGYQNALTLWRMNIQDRHPQGHGTAMSGIIAARGWNGVGIVGINHKGNLMTLKSFTDDGAGWVDDQVAAMEYAMDMKRRRGITRMIFNASWGGYLDDPGPLALYDAIKEAGTKGILFVCAAGQPKSGENDAGAPKAPNSQEFPGRGVDLDSLVASGFNFYPAFFRSLYYENESSLLSGERLAALHNVITVGASEWEDRGNPACEEKAWFSNWGASSVDFFAPGQDILSTRLGGNFPPPPGYDIPDTNTNGYGYMDGTSASAAMASGSAALLWSYREGSLWNNTNWAIKGMLLNGVDDGLLCPDPYGCGYPYIPYETKAVTEGRLNLDRAMTPDRHNNGYTQRAAVFGVYKKVAEKLDYIKLEGVKFGASPGKLHFHTLGVTYPLPAADIMAWGTNGIIAQVTTAWPRGHGRIQVENSTPGTGISRGAWFSNVSSWTSSNIVGQSIRKHGLAAYAQYQDNLFILGGHTENAIFGDGPTTEVERINLSNLADKNINPQGLKTAVDYAGAAVAIVPGTPPNFHPRIFVVGGSLVNNATGPGDAHNKIQIYDILTGAWHGEANVSLPSGLIGPTVVWSPNTNPDLGHAVIYIFGGFDGNAYTNGTYMYDPVTDTLSSRASMPHATSLAAGAHTEDGKIWIMGGTDLSLPGNAQCVVQVYDPANNTWYTDKHLLKRRTGAAGKSDGLVPFIFAGAGDDVGYFPVAPATRVPLDAEAYRGVHPTTFNQEVINVPPLYTPSLGRVDHTFYLVGGLDVNITPGGPPYAPRLTNNIYAWTNPVP